MSSIPKHAPNGNSQKPPHVLGRIGVRGSDIAIDSITHVSHGHNILIRLHNATPGHADVYISTNDPVQLYRELTAAAETIARSYASRLKEVA